MLASKLTSKFQTTIPEKVRKTLGLKKGDAVAFDIGKGNVITLRKATPVDLQFVKSLESTLSEWESENDEEAFRGL